jgi:hypothetical protein
VREVTRDLLTVVRTAAAGGGGGEGGVEIASRVFAVRGLAGEGLDAIARPGGGLFPLDSRHNVCFVVADRVKRRAIVLYSPWAPLW